MGEPLSVFIPPKGKPARAIPGAPDHGGSDMPLYDAPVQTHIGGPIPEWALYAALVPLAFAVSGVPLAFWVAEEATVATGLGIEMIEMAEIEEIMSSAASAASSFEEAVLHAIF